MERNTETLSTRDLASPNEQAGSVTTSEGDVRDAAAPEDQPGVYDDQAAPAADGAGLPVDEPTAPTGEARTGAPAGIGAPRRHGPMLASTQRAAPRAVPPRAGRRRRHKPPRRRIRTPRQRPIRRARRPPPRTAGRCFRPRWTPPSNKGGRKSRRGSSTSPEGRSRTPIAWSRTSCSNSQRASPRNGNGSKRNGAAARTSPPRICGSPCSATGRSSSACCRPDNRSRITPRGPADAAGPRALWPRRLRSGPATSSIAVALRVLASATLALYVANFSSYLPLRNEPKPQ